MRRLILLLFLISSLTILPVRTTTAEEGVLPLFVTNTEETPLSGAVLSPKGGGSESAPTDPTGRTKIKLPRGAKPGKWVTLQLVRGPGGAPGWVLVSPWDGRTALPEMDDSPDNYLSVIIAKKADRKILKNARAMASIAGGVLRAEASLSVTAGATAEQRQVALGAQANVIGLETGEIDESIRASLAGAKDRYDRGLLALYDKKFPDAVAELNKFLEETTKSSGKTASAGFFLGQAYQAVGDYKKAVEAYRLNTASDVLSFSALGLAYKLAGDERSAEIAFSRALSSNSTESMSKIQLMTNLQKLYDPQKQAETLARLYNNAEFVLEHEFFNLTVESVDELEGFAQNLNKEDQARYLSSLNEALNRSSTAGDKRGQAKVLASMGSVYFWSRDYEKALDYYQNAERMAGSTNQSAQVKATLGIATSYEYQKQYDKAIEYFVKALPSIKELDNPELESFALQHIGQSYVGLKKPEEAKKYFEQVAVALRRNFGPEDPSLYSPLTGLARVYHDQGNYAEAQKKASEILVIKQKALGPDSPYIVSTILSLAELARLQKGYNYAIRLYQQSLAILEKTNTWNKRDNVNYVVLRLAGVYEEQDKLSEAKPLYERSLSLDNREIPERAITLSRLARISAKAGDKAAARNLYQQAVDIIAKSDPARSDLTQILKDYASFLRDINDKAEEQRVEAMIRNRPFDPAAARP